MNIHLVIASPNKRIGRYLNLHSFLLELFHRNQSAIRDGIRILQRLLRRLFADNSRSNDTPTFKITLISSYRYSSWKMAHLIPSAPMTTSVSWVVPSVKWRTEREGLLVEGTTEMQRLLKCSVTSFLSRNFARASRSPALKK